MTPRRIEILQLLSEGLQLKEIASKLGLSPRTIEGHLEKMMFEYDCKTRCQLMIWAIREGFIECHSKKEHSAQPLQECICPCIVPTSYRIP